MNSVKSFAKCHPNSVLSKIVPGGVYKPMGMCIEPRTHNIYIIDCYTATVITLDSEFNYLFKFDVSSSNSISAKPANCLLWEIAILNNKLLITDSNRLSAFEIFSLDGYFISRYEDPSLYSIHGIDVNLYNDIYFCDFYRHHVIALVDGMVPHVQIIGDGELQAPVAVKCVNSLIFVLDEVEPFMKEYNFNGKLLRKFLTLKSYQEHNILFLQPYFFTVDNNENIILTSHSSDSIIVFVKNGEILVFNSLQEEFNLPNGLAIDHKERVIITVSSDNCFLKVF